MFNPLSDAQIVSIAQALASAGFVVLPEAIPAAQILPFRERILQIFGSGEMRAAGIGRAQSAQTAPQVRSDATFWLKDDGENEADKAALAWLEHLRVQLNAQLFLALDHAEAHYALYPPGGHYSKHLDRHRDSDARVLSIVLYLNESWQNAWGGQLKLYDAADTLLATVEPHAGTIVVFRSEQFPHEVVPAAQMRMSIAAWLRRRT